MATADDPSTLAGRALGAIAATLEELDAAGLRLPSSTLRLQLGPDLDLAAVAGLVPLLAELGADAAYLSPITQAAPGSTSGYDAIDHGAISAELGGDAGLAAVTAALAEHGMTALFDVVPNHAGGVPWHNPDWLDVLTWGRDSARAPWFDIDWEAPGELRGRLLLAELGDSVEATIAAGDLPIALDGDRGGRRLVLRPPGGAVLPLSPPTWPLVLDAAAARLEDAGRAAELHDRHGGEHGAAARAAAAAELRRIGADLAGPAPAAGAAAAERLLAELPSAHPLAAAALDAELDALNGPGGAAAKLALLDAQPWLLDHWQRSLEDINYRRFFDIRSLAGLRQEDPAVFEATNARMLAAVMAAGHRAGLRIDHPGGLADPEGYLAALQLRHLTAWALTVAAELAGDSFDRAAVAAAVAGRWAATKAERPASPLARPLWVVVESVLSLEEGEDLPASWPVHGDVGYGPLNLLTHLQLDPAGAARLAGEVWPRVAGPRPGQRALAHDSKIAVVDGVTLAGGAKVAGPLRPDADLLTRRLGAIAAAEPEGKSIEPADLGLAVREIAAALSVYRTYTGDGGELPAPELRLLDSAVAAARAAVASQGAREAVDWLGEVLTRAEAPPEVVAVRRRFEQFSAPLAAKGLEDRLLYVHHPDPAANEVGGDPGTTGIGPAAWHEALARRLDAWPGALTATSTHDTKRAADVRARLAVLTELPGAWAGFLDGMLARVEPMRADTPAGRAPSGNELYLLLATLVGTWPATDLAGRGPAAAGYAERIAAYMAKALREGKESTSWLAQDQAWEAATSGLVAAVLADPACLAELRAFTAGQLAVPGMVNGLALVVLKLIGPVPDVYQRELGWDTDLVDPDNRGPVDWPALRVMLDGFAGHLAAAAEGTRTAAPGPGTAAFARELLAAWPDGRVKLWVTMLGLHARNRHRRLHRHGAWLPAGPADERAAVVAGARVLGDDCVLTVAPRLTAARFGTLEPPVGAAWGDDELALPSALPAGTYANALTGARVDLGGPSAPLAELLADLPVAILEREGDQR